MASDQASSVELRANFAAGGLASKGKEEISVPSDNTENYSVDQGFKHFPTWSSEAIEYKGSTEEKQKKMMHDDINSYLPLYKAAIKNDWKSAKEILEKDDRAVTAKITFNSKTVLLVAVGITHDIQFLTKLLDFMKTKSLLVEDTDDKNNTALSLAASAGNCKAASLLVEKNGDLLQKRNEYNRTPLHEAARCGREETVRYLLSVVAKDKGRSHFTGNDGVVLLNLLILADFYDIALDLLKDYSKLAPDQDQHKLALDQDRHKRTAFITLANKPLAFASGSQLGYWQRKIYDYIPMEMDNVSNKPMGVGDEQNPTEISQNTQQISTTFDIPKEMDNVSDKPIEGGDGENPTDNTQQISTAFDIPVEMDNVSDKPMEGGDEENPTDSTQQISTAFEIPAEMDNVSGKPKKGGEEEKTAFGTLCRKVHVMLWSTLKRVPCINHIHDAKLKHKQSLELVRCLCDCLCNEVARSGANALEALETPLHIAARLVLHRHEKVFILLHQIGSQKEYVGHFKDKFKNNLLHLAGKLKPSTQVSGAALQMQRELQWFKEVEKFVESSFREEKNSDKKTPREVFTEEHKELSKQAEEWMKTTAESCSVVAALIVTVAFAAAFTVPGGNNSEKGIPIFLHKLSFMVFAVSDAISLFFSTTSVLMFLGILTSRYSEEDFLKSLPTKLIIGLIALFISIASTIIAFSATLYIVVVHQLNWAVIVVPTAVLACLPVTSFAFIQFPILVEILSSTYGPSIFRQQSEDYIL